MATPGWFRVHALRPALGRLFDPDDLRAGGNRVAVVSHAFWAGALGGDPRALGRPLVLDGDSFTIVGVLPADAWIHRFAAAEVWVPLTAIADDVTSRAWRGFVAVGRLAPGATLAAARAELARIRDALAAEHPDSNAGWGLRVDPLEARVTAPVRATLWMFFAAVALVLLVGCANVAGLMLVRASERAQELAIRASLGASRRRLAAHLLVEAALLSFLGAGLGFLLALWGVDAFVALAPPSIPRLSEVRADLAAFLFTVVLAVATTVLFGVLPAVRASRVGVEATLRAGPTGGARGRVARDLLVLAEIAVAITLLAGASLMTRGFGRLAGWQPDLDRDRLVVVWALAPSRSGASAGASFDRAAGALRALPGVTAVGQASAGPLFGGEESDELRIGDQPPAPARWYDMTPGTFAALGIPVVRGRDLAPSDTAGSAPVALVNETLARRYFGGDALGRSVTMRERTMAIVGVVRDVPAPAGGHPGPEIYWPRAQAPRLATYLVIRTVGPAAPMLAALERLARARIAEVDADLQLTAFRVLADLEAEQLVGPRFRVVLMDAFALAALALAAVGIHGLIAHAVARRRREIAIRIAVGARPARVAARVVLGGLALAAAGSVLGVAAALPLAGLVSRFLYGVPASDPASLLVMGALFLVATVLACAVPALRAARVDPMRVLRAE